MFEVFEQGSRLALAWGQDAGGRMRGKKYFQGLSKPDKAKVLARMKRYADSGGLHNEEQFRHISGSVFELKIHKRRLIGYRSDNLFVICDGFDKATDRDQRSDRNLAAAIKRAEEWQATYERSAR
jgi:Phage derived protein Gp49-like (DUF891)